MTQSIFPAAGGLKKVVRGYASTPSHASWTAVTISSVDLAKSELRYLGHTNKQSDYSYWGGGGVSDEPWQGGAVQLVTSTRVDVMTRGSMGEILFEVTEWQ